MTERLQDFRIVEGEDGKYSLGTVIYEGERLVEVQPMLGFDTLEALYEFVNRIYQASLKSAIYAGDINPTEEDA